MKTKIMSRARIILTAMVAMLAIVAIGVLPGCGGGAAGNDQPSIELDGVTLSVNKIEEVVVTFDYQGSEANGQAALKDIGQRGVVTVDGQPVAITLTFFNAPVSQFSIALSGDKALTEAREIILSVNGQELRIK